MEQPQGAKIAELRPKLRRTLRAWYNAAMIPNDTAAILEQLRAEVLARRARRPDANDDATLRDLRRALDEIELHRVVSAHWPLVARSLPERAINLVNKLVRRGLRWYINPIVEQQNAYNDAVARALRLLADGYAELAEQFAERADQTPVQPAPPMPPAVPSRAAAPLAEIQRDIDSRGAQEQAAPFTDLALAALLPAAIERRTVHAHWPLGGHSAASRAVALVQKMLRQYLRWYINPIVEQQNAANDASCAALLAAAAADAELRACAPIQGGRAA